VAHHRPGRTVAEARRGLRLDVEGLRAVAILAVLAYHAGLPFLPGGFAGVDIFFVISGYLITGLLVREAERDGRISLSRFYARRAKRLLPAAAVVFVVTAIGTALVFAGSQARVFGGDITAAAAYVVNWRLAARSVNYLAQDTGQSPVLHFWSLSLEEQYYFVWPLLAIFAIVVARKLNRSARVAMAVGLLGVIGIPSFVYALYLAHSNAAVAFFVTPTRMWELAVGAAVALGTPLIVRLRRHYAQALALAGAIAMAVTLLVLHDTVTWPGIPTLLPVLGTAAVLTAGVADPRTFVGRLLGIRPMVWVGALSYSLYLWHWPILVLANGWLGDLRISQKSMLVVFAVIPAYLSMRFIENPVRFSPRFAARARPALLMGLSLTLVGVGAGFAVAAVHPPTTSPVAHVTSIPDVEATLVGAMVLGTHPLTSPAGDPNIVPGSISPDPPDAPDDVPSAYAKGCQAQPPDIEPIVCVAGDPNGDVRIAAVGDSKLLQYYDALDLIGKSRGWRIEFMTKSACSWTADTIELDGAPYTECSAFDQAVLATIQASPFDFVLTSGSPYRISGRATTTDEERAKGLATAWEEAAATGATVVVLAEPPRPVEKPAVFDCVDKHRSDPGACAYDRADGVDRSAVRSQLLAAGMVPGTRVVSVSDYVCPQASCAPVIGNVLVLRQGSHMTNTYAVTLAPVLGERLARAIVEGDELVGPTFTE